MRQSTALSAATLVLVLGGSAAEAAAQGIQTGIIRGTVTDQQGLPVENATVTASSPSMQGTRVMTTAADGSYAFLQLRVGIYELTFETSSFAPARRTVSTLLGLSVEQNVLLQTAGVIEQVQVTAPEPAPTATATVGANYKHDEIDALATLRSLFGIAQLAPGVTSNTPNADQLAINGAFAFDNVFMLNGVDVSDNLFGSPQNLFIEEAIEETSVMTSGITAEYGRFTGGVINAVTKSGGNTFQGTFRVNFSSPSWTEETPFEKCDPAVTAATCSPSPARVEDLQMTYEAILGGPIVRDRLWFFGAGRFSDLSTAGTLPQTNLANTKTETNKRGEVKMTATAMSNHTFQGGYLNNSTKQANRPTFDFTIDTFAVGDRTLPNWSAFVNYRGVLRNNLLAEAQISQRKFGFRNSGGTSTNIVDSPFMTLNQALGHFNAQYFDVTDPQNRNNSQLTGNLTYFVNTASLGRHEIKSGYEFFRSQLTGGNSQSATGYVFDADYATDAAGSPLFDAEGHLIPVFTTGETLIEHWIPVRAVTLNVDNNSLYVQDHLIFNDRWSADLGLRYEHVRSEASGGVLGIDTTGFVPRLAVAFDVQGDERHVVHATYGHYSGRYNEAQIGANNNVGKPDLLFGYYIGPSGQGRDFAPGFHAANYLTVLGQFPTANIFFEDGLSSPIVKEFTTSYGTDIMNGRGYADATYVVRKTSNIIEDTVALANGVTNIVKNGSNLFTFTNVVYRNMATARREYQGMLFRGRYRITPHWVLNGHYTLQLQNNGNYEGESTNIPGETSRIGDFPEAFTAGRHYPDGHLDDFQRHKLRFWSTYNHRLDRFGDLSLSGLWRVDSATTYSLAAAGQPITATQVARLSAYPDLPDRQTVYFGDRGAEFFKGYGVLDVGIGYNIPVFRTVRPWFKFDIYNALNNQKQIRWNTTVRQDPASTADSLGLRTGYLEGAVFGRANSNTHFPVPFSGLTGGRTFRMAVGLRF